MRLPDRAAGAEGTSEARVRASPVGVDEEVAAAASFAAWDGFCVELLEALTSER